MDTLRTPRVYASTPLRVYTAPQIIKGASFS